MKYCKECDMVLAIINECAIDSQKSYNGLVHHNTIISIIRERHPKENINTDILYRILSKLEYDENVHLDVNTKNNGNHLFYKITTKGAALLISGSYEEMELKSRNELELINSQIVANKSALITNKNTRTTNRILIIVFVLTFLATAGQCYFAYKNLPLPSQDKKPDNKR